MRKKYLLFFSAAVLVLLSACQKEVDFPPGQNPGTGNNNGNPGNGNGNGNPSGQGITGEYDFVGVTVQTLATMTVNDGGDDIKSVTTSYYISKDNVGTATITATELKSNNIGYTIDTVMNSKTYINSVLTDDIDVPLFQIIAPASNSSPYVLNGSDSLTVTGAFGPGQGTSGAPPVTQQGYNYSWAGDTLLLSFSASYTQTVNQGGVAGILQSAATGVTRLKKK